MNREEEGISILGETMQMSYQGKEFFIKFKTVEEKITEKEKKDEKNEKKDEKKEENEINTKISQIVPQNNKKESFTENFFDFLSSNHPPSLPDDQMDDDSSLSGFNDPISLVSDSNVVSSSHSNISTQTAIPLIVPTFSKKNFFF